MSLWLFNAADGFSEAVLRGDKAALLSSEDYRRLMASETLSDLRSGLEDTDYGNFLQDEPEPLTVATLEARMRERLFAQFRNLQAQAGSELRQFLQFIVAEKMIDNVVSLIQGVVNRKPMEELLANADPMGWTPEMRALLTYDASAGYDELYRSVLIDTPVGRYFANYLQQRGVGGGGGGGMGGHGNPSSGAHPNAMGGGGGQQFQDMDLEIMRACLKKAWLEDFYDYCHRRLSGSGQELMEKLLSREADFLVIAVTLNSLNSPMSGSTQLLDKSALFPHFGNLYPNGTDALRKAYNDATIRAALESHSLYLELYENCKDFYIKNDADRSADAAAKNAGSNDKDVVDPDGKRSHSDTTDAGAVATAGGADLLSFEEAVYRHRVKLCEFAFEQQMNYAGFYAWYKLKEQEIKNLLWIADMILMNRPDQMEHRVLPAFSPRY